MKRERDERYGWRAEERYPHWSRFEDDDPCWNAERIPAEIVSAEVRSPAFHVPLQPELRAALEELLVGLQQAVTEQETNEKPVYDTCDGVLLRQSDDGWIYQFSLLTLCKVEEQSSLLLTLASKEQQTARMVKRVGTKLLLSLPTPLASHLLAKVTFTEERAWLLQRQQRVVEDYLQGKLQPAADLGEKVLGLVPSRSGAQQVKSWMGSFVPDRWQQRAIEQALGSDVTIIVGPAGTGKSAVEATLTTHLLKRGYSILTLSHTNIATDHLFLRQLHAIEESGDPQLLDLLHAQRIVRAGARVQHRSLLSGESGQWTVNAIAQARMGPLDVERQQLEERNQELARTCEKHERRLENLSRRVHTTHEQEQRLPEREIRQAQQQIKKEQAVLEQLQGEQVDIQARLEALSRQHAESKRQIVADAQLVATTATAAFLSYALLGRTFDVVILDEVSMIPLGAILLAAMRARRYMVLSGDPMQLSPIFQTKRYDLPRELPELYRWMASDVLSARQVSLFDASEQKNGYILLVQQGRMHPKILAPLNHLVYQGMLLSRPETEDAPPIGPCPQWPLMLVDSSHAPDSQVHKPIANQARVNAYHARLAIALIPQILSTLPARPPAADPSMPRIGILAPYRSQVNLIWQLAHQAGLAEHIHVGTVNSVQALEFEVVIFDTVEAPTRQQPSQPQRVLPPFHFAFDRVLDDYGVATHATRLLNVAHSRARHKLIYLAHRQHLHHYQPANPKSDPAQQRLLVDLVDWAAREGSLPSATVLAKSVGDEREWAG